jgi:hypothetical protein
MSGSRWKRKTSGGRAAHRAEAGDCGYRTYAPARKPPGLSQCACALFSGVFARPPDHSRMKESSAPAHPTAWVLLKTRLRGRHRQRLLTRVPRARLPGRRGGVPSLTPGPKGPPDLLNPVPSRRASRTPGVADHVQLPAALLVAPVAARDARRPTGRCGCSPTSTTSTAVSRPATRSLQSMSASGTAGTPRSRHSAPTGEDEDWHGPRSAERGSVERCGRAPSGTSRSSLLREGRRTP